MRPGDSIVVGRAEAELLTSDAFNEVASPDLASKVLLSPTTRAGEADYYRLALPKIGARIIEVLTDYAAREDVEAREAIVAEGLATAIAQRVSPS
jgi:hypothetical protein